MSFDESIPEGVILDNPQMPTLSSEQNAEESSSSYDVKKDPEFGVGCAGVPTWDEIIGLKKFKIGIVLGSSSTSDIFISAISNPASSCSFAALVVLHPKEHETEPQSMFNWLQSNRLDGGAKNISFGWGQKGFEDLLNSDVDALYIIVPPGSQRDYVLSSLQAGKHVLLNDPVSTSLPEFKEQQEFAKRYGKFIQFSTMFVHQYRVLRFMDRVLYDEGFGRINSIEASVRLNYEDVEKVGVSLPLGPNDGSIRVLGRFCVLFSTLFFSRCGSFARSAKIEKIQMGENGVMVSASGRVKFTEGRELLFDVGYVHTATRQSVDLKADARYASMKDFVLEHPDGLATYRVYEKAAIPSGEVVVVNGESIDVAGGPPQATMMWRSFVGLSHSLDQQGGWTKTDETAECRELANVAFQTKRILIALMKSVGNSFDEIIIDDIDYQ